MEAANEKAIPLYPILLVNFIGTLGFSIVLPFLVTLVLKFGGNAVVYGVMGATYSAFQLVGAPILGRWSDVYGRRRILLLSQAGTLVSWVVFLTALYLPATPLANVNSPMLGNFVLTVPLVTVFAARALDGLTGGNVSVANAYLADITDLESRPVGSSMPTGLDSRSVKSSSGGSYCVVALWDFLWKRLTSKQFRSIRSSWSTSSGRSALALSCLSSSHSS